MTTTTKHPARVWAEVDLSAVRANVTRLAEVAGEAALMVVVKANGYGHGMVEVARAARDAGAPWLGAAVLEEAVALRAAGDTGRILTWLATPGESYDEAVSTGIDVTASACWQLADIVASARRVGRRSRLQLKVDTGLARNGASVQEWPQLLAAAGAAQDRGEVLVTGVWSHFACADDPEHRANDAQERRFRGALVDAHAAGLDLEVTHLANSAGALLRPSSRFDLVRCGIAAYGLSPAPRHATAAELGLRPAMTLRARLAAVRTVSAGQGVSYGWTHETSRPASLGLVPVGYGDGIPRHASNRAHVQVGGVRAPVVGQVCMDQIVVDLSAVDAQPGDEVVLFGAGDLGEPTAQDWADAAGTISYEVVTRLGGRIDRRFVGPDAA
ncbi:MAG: alanine racemase [Actinomycetota bacterium]|nr:alanine racemase [Actinomycetota bacterium]